MNSVRHATANALAMAIILATLAGLACMGISVLSGHTVTVGDGQSLVNMHNPVQEAQATRVALVAADEAAARELERQAAEAAGPALTLRNTLMAIGAGVGALVFVVGLAFAAVAWVNKRATAVYPNSAGLYPLIVRRFWNGVTIVHDGNRALGPTTIYTAPSLASGLLEAIGVRQGGAGAQFPQPGSEPAVMQITGQAQVAQIAAAQNRWPRLPPVAGRMTVKEGGTTLPPPAARMPAVQVIQDPEQIENFEQRLLEGGRK
ncbi:MAG: hypothetical protein JW850_02585 [Thermoflexales bacterium]|nr:hypothetical protein [Thermoflexales bacterium]